jgi:hypothetical protein
MHLLETNREAHKRGRHLLTQNLSPSQRDQYETRGYFEVVGGTTGKRYRIRNGRQMNVEELDKHGKPAGVLCFMPQGGLVVGVPLARSCRSTVLADARWRMACPAASLAFSWDWDDAWLARPLPDEAIAANQRMFPSSFGHHGRRRIWQVTPWCPG